VIGVNIALEGLENDGADSRIVATLQGEMAGVRSCFLDSIAS
jgi:hypothetical protein